MTNLGQVFTKNNVAQYMVSLFELPKSSNILEPCYGDGAFLDALISEKFTNVTAFEIDTKLFEKTKNKYNQYKLFNTDFLKYDDEKKYDGIIMNPPYIRQEKIDELNCYGITKKSLRCNPIFSNLPSTANMYMYFIMKAIDLLKDEGQLIVIFPCSWMKAKMGEKFKKLLISKCGLEKQINIYGEVFEKEALVKVVILKLIKGKNNLITNEEFIESKNGTLNKVALNEKDVLKMFKCPFSKLATVKRGLTTGCNKMYINPNLNIEKDECLKKIISSPKSIYGYTTANAKLDILLYPKEDKITTEVDKYLKMWQNKIIQERKPKTLYEKISNNNKKWYELHEICGDGILFSYFVRNDMKFVMNEMEVMVRDNFYIIKSSIDKKIMFALLNNYYTYYQLETIGKRYGAGLLKLQRYDIEELKFPEIESISEDDIKEIRKLSKRLLKTNNLMYLDKITKLISKYSNISFEDIKERYYTIKENRLEAK